MLPLPQLRRLHGLLLIRMKQTGLWGLPQPCRSSPSEKARSFRRGLQAMIGEQSDRDRDRDRFLFCMAPCPHPPLPSFVSIATIRLRCPVSRVRIPSRLHSIPRPIATPTPNMLRQLSFRTDLPTPSAGRKRRCALCGRLSGSGFCPPRGCHGAGTVQGYGYGWPAGRLFLGRPSRI
jgi:hypothetical protein